MSLYLPELQIGTRGHGKVLQVLGFLSGFCLFLLPLLFDRCLLFLLSLLSKKLLLCLCSSWNVAFLHLGFYQLLFQALALI